MQTPKGSKGGVERPIRTALVLRPVIKEDLRHDLKELTLQHGPAGYELLLPDGSSVSGPGLAVYSSQALNPDLLCKDLVEELIVSAFHGETACVLAMGQTGSGKSRVMGTECRRAPTANGMAGQGWANSVGQYVPRRIFELAREQQLESLEVECAMVEVYSQKQHDSVRDLLALGRPQIDRPAAPLKHLQWFPAADAQELQSRLLEGSDARETSRTMGNNRSSRSHAIFMIKITHTRREDGDKGSAMTKVSAQLMLVDLAGSEQAALAATGSTTFKEGAGINLGLLSLGGVIEDLAHGNPPQYSNCALTRILKPALGGTANAVIVGCISPLVAHIEYTKRTLLYLAKAGTIKNTVKADVRAVKRAESERSAAEVRELRAQLQKLQLAQSAGSPDSVVLSRTEYQRLVHQAESERLRADILATMLRHATARITGPAVGSGVLPSSPSSPAADIVAAGAAAPTESGAGARSVTSSSAELPSATGAGAIAVAAEGAGLVREAAGNSPQVGFEESAEGQPRGRRSLELAPPAACSGAAAIPAATLQSPGEDTCSPTGQEPCPRGLGQDSAERGLSPNQQQQARPALQRQLTRTMTISPLLATLASSLATESDDSMSGEAVEVTPWGCQESFSVSNACLERESNLDPEQLDLLKVSLDQELRTLRRKRAQQAQQQLSAMGRSSNRKMNSSSGSSRAASSSTLTSVPPQSIAEVQAWAQGVAEQHTSAVGWQYVVDSLQHDLGYLQLRLNTLQLLGGEVLEVNFTLQLPQAADAWQQQQQLEQLRADLAAKEQQLKASQQAQQQAQAALWESPSQQLSWLGQPGTPTAEQVAAALLAELVATKLQARQLEQQLFQQRLACSTLEISLRAYNSCLGETEQELAEAAAEIQVLHKEREEFQQAIEEKMRYVQQAAAAQNALELLHSEVRQLERQLFVARQESQQPQQSTPPRSLSSSLMAWAGLGRSPSSAAVKATSGAHPSDAGQSPRTSQPSSQANSIPGSPRYTTDGAGNGGGNRRSISWHGSEAASPGSSPTRQTYSGSPRDAWHGGRQGEPTLMRNSPLGKQAGARSERLTG